MATTTVSQSVNRGGAFLVTPITPAEIFTPAEITDDQRLIGQTAAEFIAKEIIPLIPDLEKHKEGLMPQALKKAGEIGLLGAGIPEAYGGSELDKISATVLTEKISVYASFAVAFGGTSGNRHDSHRKLWHRGAEKEIPAKDRIRRTAGCLLPVGTAGWVGFARGAHAGRALA